MSRTNSRRSTLTKTTTTIPILSNNAINNNKSITSDIKRASGSAKLSIIARYENALNVKRKPYVKPTFDNDNNNNTESNTTQYDLDKYRQRLQQEQSDLENNEKQKQLLLLEQQKLYEQQQLNQLKQQQEYELAEKQRLEYECEQRRILEEEQERQRKLQAELAEQQRIQYEQEQYEYQQQQIEFDRIRLQAIENEKLRINSEKARQHQLKLQQEQDAIASKLIQAQQYEINIYNKAIQYYNNRLYKQYISQWQNTINNTKLAKYKLSVLYKRVTKNITKNIQRTAYNMLFKTYNTQKRYRTITNQLHNNRNKYYLINNFKAWKYIVYESKQYDRASTYHSTRCIKATLYKLQQYSYKYNQYKQHKLQLQTMLSNGTQQYDSSLLTSAFKYWIHTTHINIDNKKQLAEQQRLQDEQNKIIQQQGLIEAGKQAEELKRINELKQQQLEQQRIQDELEAKAKADKLAEIEKRKQDRLQYEKNKKLQDKLQQEKQQQNELVETLVKEQVEIAALDIELDQINDKYNKQYNKAQTLQDEISNVLQQLDKLHIEINDLSEQERIEEAAMIEKQKLDQKRLKLLHVLFDPLVHNKQKQNQK